MIPSYYCLQLSEEEVRIQEFVFPPSKNSRFKLIRDGRLPSMGSRGRLCVGPFKAFSFSASNLSSVSSVGALPRFTLDLALKEKNSQDILFASIL